jgi:hypothetical protein
MRSIFNIVAEPIKYADYADHLADVLHLRRPLATRRAQAHPATAAPPPEPEPNSAGAQPTRSGRNRIDILVSRLSTRHRRRSSGVEQCFRKAWVGGSNPFVGSQF